MLTIELADVILDKDSDLIFMTVGMYKLFLSRAGGRDARDLYLHLMFTARMQETNQVWANKAYLKNGLSLGDARLKHAKALLKKLGLIEYVQAREKGKVGKTYIRLTKIWSRPAGAAGSVSEPAAESPFLPQGRFAAPPVQGPLNALSEKENKKDNTPPSAPYPAQVKSPAEYTPGFETFWSTYPRQKEKRAAFATWRTALKKGASEADLIRAAENYARQEKIAGTEERFIKLPATFLGPKEPWRDFTQKQDSKPRTVDEIGAALFGRGA